MSEYIPYPDLDNKNFYKKIYHKKEFYDTKVDKLPDPSNQSDEILHSIFQEDKDFKLQKGQIFLRNFISELTPYNGILIFHGTGTGKTCAAITIAERFHSKVNETGRKILIIAERIIQNEFLKTIFNFEKEVQKKPKQIVQCTGKTYKISEELKYLPLKKKESLISKIINEIYEISGRISLVNKLFKETGWDGLEENLNDYIKQKIDEEYSNRVIIIDEVHNNLGTIDKEGKFPFVMETIITYSKNVKLILMSATPMVNKASDILYSINLLRINDKRPKIKERSIFKNNENNENFEKGGEKLFKEICKGYVSYIRGGDPPRFPFKIIPSESVIPSPEYLFNGDKIPIDKKIQHTYLIECIMNPIQYTTYKHVLANEIVSNIYETIKTGGLLFGPSLVCNISFPSLTDIGMYGRNGYGTSKSSENAVIETKDINGNLIYQYSSFSEGFLLRENINKYSTKYTAIYDNIIYSIGISFVYSAYLWGGIYPLAFMLEENGFEPALITGKEYSRFQSKTRKPTICYMCGKVKHDSKDHEWSPARYVIISGSDNLLQSDIAKISGYINRKDNMYGKLVKVLLGSEVSGEGIDFKRIRQVHILEPWYNQATIDQIEGRSIRNGSHIDLPPEQRNVEIFKYCAIPPNNNKREDKIETIDEYMYRLTEDKDKKIKKVEYLLKEIAVDCLFQKENNIRNIQRNIKLENSRGHIINYVYGDKPYSRECNYMKNCDYKCEWEPTKIVDINKSTYSIDFADLDIEKARDVIIEMYKKNFAYDIDTIFSNIKKSYKLEDIYIYLALESLMKKKGDYYVKDRYGRVGYLVEKGKLFIYQPTELDDEKAPFLYKSIPLETKPKYITFSENIKDTEVKDSKKGDSIFIELYNYYELILSILREYINNIEKYNDILYSIVFYSLSNKNTFKLLKYIVSPLYIKNKNKDIESFKNIAVKYYTDNGNIFNKSSVSIMVGNLSAKWNTSKMSKSQNEKWRKNDDTVEIIMINNLNEINNTKLYSKIPKNIKYNEKSTKGDYFFTLKKSNIRPMYIGTREEKITENNKYLKLFNFTSRHETNKVSKRNELRGMVCSSFHVPYLKKILNDLEDIINEELKMKILISHKDSRTNICIKIEFLLRLLNKYTDKVWFYEGFFYEN